MNISSNIASINAHQTMLDNSAHNIANVNTDHYVPINTTITDNKENIIANSHKATDNGSEKSQTNLAKEIPDMMISQGGVALNVTAIKTQDEMLGTLLDLKA